jgi:hypothetical protein
MVTTVEYICSRRLGLHEIVATQTEGINQKKMNQKRNPRLYGLLPNLNQQDHKWLTNLIFHLRVISIQRKRHKTRQS